MKKFLLLLSVSTFVLSPAALRAETLAELTESSGNGWMIGKWTTGDGAASISYNWKLDKHVIGVSFKMGDRESEGMIMRKPGTEDVVVYGAVDNVGGATQGKWMEFEGNPTLIAKSVEADGTEKKFAVSHSKAGDGEMTVKLMALGDDGKPDATKSQEFLFHKEK